MGREKIALTVHGERQMRGRLGSGCVPEVIARRCWDRGERPPPEWEVPMKPRFTYLKYGDCVFIYGHGKFQDVVLVTVVGPFGQGKKWQRKNRI